MRNSAIAAFLDEIGDLLEIQGEGFFKVRAYREAARRIGSMSEPIESYLEKEGGLRTLPAVGEAISKKVEELLTTGRSSYLERLHAQWPASLLTLMQVPGVGPKTAGLLYQQLRVTTVDDLEAAARDGRLAGLPKFKEKTIDNILAGIERWRRRTTRTTLGRAMETATQLLESLRQVPGLVRCGYAGSLRRMRETVGDLDLLGAARDSQPVMQAFARLPLVREVLLTGATKTSVLTEDNLQVDLRVVVPESYGAALQYFTGSQAHNVRVRELAQRKGLTVNEYGVFRLDDGQRVAAATEEEVYAAVGLPWFPPELRENQGEVEAALAGELPQLVELGDIRGDLHSHTNWSDGLPTLEELVEGARQAGYQYLLVTDHSKGIGIARGLSEEKVAELHEAIRRLDASDPGLRVLHGTEVNIRRDGTLDYDDETMSLFDVVVASVHDGFDMSGEQITARIVSAMRNPFVDVVGHPTGRLIGRRERYEVDMEVVFRVAAETGTALEVNASPERLDLCDSHVRRALQLGGTIAINTDAHFVKDFENLTFGVATARRGWAGKGSVLNALSCEELLDRVAKKRLAASN